MVFKRVYCAYSMQVLDTKKDPVKGLVMVLCA